MRKFADLFRALDATTKINEKVTALADYFENATDDDSLWTIALLSHRRPRRTVTTTLLREWAAEYSGLPLWLFEESYHVVGDLAETITLITPEPSGDSNRSLTEWIDFIRDLKPLEEEEKKERILHAWSRLDLDERFVFNKLITGGWRVGISRKLMVRALGKATGIGENLLSLRLMGDWSPDTTTFGDLVLTDRPGESLSRPYPFFLAYPLESHPDDLGIPEEWAAEYKWDGIRGQLVIRGGEHHSWSRGEELVTDKYPEYEGMAQALPNGTVLDGEIMPFADGRPLSFHQLQRRIGRKKVGKKLLKEVPVVFMAYDILEMDGKDIRPLEFRDRRSRLEKVFAAQDHPALLLSPLVEYSNWDELAKLRDGAREKHSEGLMLKRLDSPYRVGRKKGDWWKWKVDPLTVDALLIYSQRGHGRRANLYTDFTFAVWDGDTLVPFAKAYSGLTDAEFREINRYIQRNTLERYGPVRAVKPELVFEIAFEGINASNRHKSGISVRFPRMKRWRKDKHPREAGTLKELNQMLETYGD